jgi:hypothetical protein
MASSTERDLRPLVRERVERAKAILGVGCNERSIEGAVWWVLIDQHRSSVRLGKRRKPKNKEEKAAINRTAKKLNSFLYTLRHDPNLPNFVKDAFHFDDLSKRLEWLEEVGRTSLKHRWGSSVAPPLLQRRAVRLAAELLHEHRIRPTTTRGGKFHRLAAALYGENIDLFDLLRRERNVKFESH